MHAWNQRCHAEPLCAALASALFFVISICDYVGAPFSAKPQAQSAQLTMRPETGCRDTVSYVWHIADTVGIVDPRGCCTGRNWRANAMGSGVAVGTSHACDDPAPLSIDFQGNAVEVALASDGFVGTAELKAFGAVVSATLKPKQQRARLNLARGTEWQPLAARILLVGFILLIIRISAEFFARKGRLRAPRWPLSGPYFGLAVASGIANIIWFALQPGTYTEDFFLNLHNATNRGHVTDLLIPGQSFVFNLIYGSFPSHIGLYLILQVYILFTGLYLTANFVSAAMHRSIGPRYCGTGTLIFLLLAANPIVIGSSTLLYADYLFTGVALWAVGLLLAAQSEASRWKGVFAALGTIAAVLSLSLRHNAWGLLPGFCLLWIGRQATSSDQRPHRFVRAGVIAFATLVVLGGGTRWFARKHIVDRTSHYQATILIYDLLGAHVSFPEMTNELSWLDEYMDTTELSPRYERYASLLQIFHPRQTLVNYDRLFADYDQVARRYARAVLNFSTQMLRIKWRHFLFTLGYAEGRSVALLPIFGDALSLRWNYVIHPGERPLYYFLTGSRDWVRGAAPSLLENSGIYHAPRFPGLRQSLRDTSRRIQNGALRFALSAAMFPAIACVGITVWALCALVTGRADSGWWGIAGVATCGLGYACTYLFATAGNFPKYGFLTYLLGSMLTLSGFLRLLLAGHRPGISSRPARTRGIRIGQ